MLLVEVGLPALGKSYDFRLHSGTPVGELVEEIAGMVCQKEQCRLEGEVAKLQLWYERTGAALSPGSTLAEQGVKNGDKLLLV